MDREITVTISSYVTPDAPLAGFQIGEPFAMNLPHGIRLDELSRRIFHKKFDEIGVMAVNGELASEERVLSPGDAIDFYPLLEGG